MIRGLFGASTLSSMLRGGLEEASATQRGIGERVARALDNSTSTDFTGTLEAQMAKARQAEVDLQRDMGSLADTQLRYEADAQLLREAYQRLRTAISSRG
jgi:flagellar basal body rod protein FlgB